MLWIYADRYGLDLAERRRTLKAMGFSRSLSDDHRSGTVTLHPEANVLRVGNAPGDYDCVRVFNGDGYIVGTMRRSPDGTVGWFEPCVQM